MTDYDAPTGAAFVYGIAFIFFGGIGALVGGILCAVGQPWHRVLVCGGVGLLVALGLVAATIWCSR